LTFSKDPPSQMSRIACRRTAAGSISRKEEATELSRETKSNQTDRPNEEDKRPAEGQVFAEIVTKDGIAKVLSFLPYLRDINQSYGKVLGGERHGEIVSMPYASLSDHATEFVEACYQANLVQSFDWTAWAEKNAALAHEGKGLESADLDCIIRLVTAHFRADRFVEGHLLEVLESGLMRRILERLQEISSAEPPVV
jgi:hypothetical protein